MERVSVIIPVFNAEKYIKKSLISILKQTYNNLEILIYDDGSTDSSWDIVSSIEDTRIKLFQHEKNQGYVKTINKLFELANSDYIAFQDADDISHPTSVRICIKEKFRFSWDKLPDNKSERKNNNWKSDC